MQTAIDARLDLEPLYPGAPAHLQRIADGLNL
jgi:hypothetical protein